MAMPKATVHEHSDPKPGEYQIRFAREVSAVDPEPVPG